MNGRPKLRIVPFPTVGVASARKESITAHPFLAGLNAECRDFLAKSGWLQDFSEGQEIFHEGDEAQHFYLIESGRVVLETFVPGRCMATIQTLGAGEALGWSWLFPPHRWHFSATATECTEVVAFAAQALREKARKNALFHYQLMVRVANLLVGRLEGLREQLIDVYHMRP